MHRHDLVPINGELIRFDKNGISENISPGFKCLYEIKDGEKPGDWYRMVFVNKEEG